MSSAVGDTNPSHLPGSNGGANGDARKEEEANGTTPGVAPEQVVVVPQTAELPGAAGEDGGDEDDLDELDEYGPPLPPDGGWGWVVVAASFICNLIVDGVCYTFGIFKDKLSDQFGSSSGKTALAGSMLPGMYLIAGPFVSALANRFGCRRVALGGSIIASISFVICTFSPNIDVMILTYGVCGGIGFGMMYLPSIVMVGFYFDKKRALATGIAVCGSGIGTFLFAPLGSFLVESFGWKGANIIFGAIILNGIVCSLVFRPLEAKRLKATTVRSPIIESIVAEKKRRRTISTGSLDGTVITKENSLIKEQHAIASRDAIKEVEEEGAASPVKTGGASNTLTVPEPSVHFTRTASEPAGSVSTQNKQVDRVKQEIPAAKSASNRSIPRATEMGSRESGLRRRSQHGSATDEERKKEMESPFVRDDIFYAGSVTTLPEYKAAPDMATYVQSVTSIPANDEVDSGEAKCYQKCGSVLTKMFDFSLLKSCTFGVLCLSGVLAFIGLYTPFVYVIEKAKSHGVEDTTASYIISVLGIFNTLSRLVAGWLADRPWADSLVIHNVSAILAGVATCCVPLLTSFETLTVYAAVFGVFIAAYIALRSIVIVDLLGIQKLTNAFGLTALFQGIAVLVGSPLSGAIFDATGSYTIPFIVSGSLIALGGVICLPARRIAKWENSRGEYKKVIKADQRV